MRKLTQEECLSKLKQIFGDKYDYSKVKYTRHVDRICLICPKHGEFYKKANKALQGQGCPLCAKEEAAKNLALTNEEFIQRLKAIFGDKYSYEKTQYINSHTKVIVTCPIHGDFEMRSSHLLDGHGCKKCAHEKNGLDRRLTTEEFINKANKIFRNKYDYSKTKYVTSCQKVIITCKEHGDFELMPSAHLGGRGCPICSQITLSQKFAKGRDKFIEEARKVHGDKYDYSKVDYVNSQTPVTIICPHHGEFKQRPNDHVNGKGCGKCGAHVPTTDEFIKQARAIHGNKYDYSKVEYKSMHDKVCITCPIHGDFLQYPYHHLRKCGCPKCKESKLEKTIRAALEERKITFISQYTFSWLKPKNVDFYLPDYHIAIECQGIQHFKASGYIFNEEKVKYTQANDKIKKELCSKNGIKLLYYSDLKIKYPYFVYTNIDDLMAEILKSDKT